MEVDAKVARRGADAILVFVFTHSDFPDEQFYAAKRYIHVTQEGEEDILFFLAEAVIPTFSAGAICPLKFDQTNRADGAEAKNAQIILSGRTSNLRLEDMVELCRQGIAIDNDNDPAPENVSSGKLKWVKTKTVISLAPRRTTFASTSTKIKPSSLWFFVRFGYLWKIDLLG